VIGLGQRFEARGQAPRQPATIASRWSAWDGWRGTAGAGGLQQGSLPAFLLSTLPRGGASWPTMNGQCGVLVVVEARQCSNTNAVNDAGPLRRRQLAFVRANREWRARSQASGILLVFEYWTLHGQGSDGQQLQCRIDFHIGWRRGRRLCKRNRVYDRSAHGSVAFFKGAEQ
jgi:hypothetical protein